MDKSEQKDSRLDLDEIWGNYFTGRVSGDGQIYRNLLIEHYRVLVKYHAEKLHSRFPSHVELDDLISYGIFGLIDAIGSFDPKRGTKFETHAYSRIRGAVLDGIREYDGVPRLIRSRSAELKKATECARLITGRNPNDEELIEELSCGDYKGLLSRCEKVNKKAEKILKDGRNIKAKSQSYLQDAAGDGIEYIEDKANAVAEVQRKEVNNRLASMLNQARERLVLNLYYYNNFTQKEIGDIIGFSETRVGQIRSKAIARLRKKISDSMRKDLEELAAGRF
jgi:RNA polymerase sigma factor FliA